MVSGAGVAHAEDCAGSDGGTTGSSPSSSPSDPSHASPSSETKTTGTTGTASTSSKKTSDTVVSTTSDVGNSGSTISSSVTSGSPKTAISSSGGFLKSEVKEKVEADPVETSKKQAEPVATADVQTAAVSVPEVKDKQTPRSEVITAAEVVTDLAPQAGAGMNSGSKVIVQNAPKPDPPPEYNSADNTALGMSSMTVVRQSIASVPKPDTADVAVSLAAVSLIAAATPPAQIITVDDAYLKPFLNADPTQRFAYTRYIVGLKGSTTTIQPLDDAAYQQLLTTSGNTFGYAGFSRNSQGNLVYTNTTKQDVLVVYGARADRFATGATLVRAGSAATLPQSAPVASAQLIANGPNTYAATAYPGAPLPKTTSNSGGGPVAIVAQVINQVVTQLVNGTNAAVAQLVKTVNTIVTLVRNSLVGSGSPSTPTSTSQLYVHLRDVTKNATNGIAIEESVVGNQKLMTVYLGGTTINWLNFTNQSLLKNTPAYLGRTDSKQTDAIAKALNGDTSVKIMLVGFSQGGMDAQNIAATASFRNQVTTMVTFASPIVRPPRDYKDVHYVHIWDHGDFVPHLTFPNHLFDYNDAHANVFERYSSNDNSLAYILNPLGLHGDNSTYEQMSVLFDKDSGYRNVKADMKKFLTYGF